MAVLLPELTRQKWRSATIPRKGKRELVQGFRDQFCKSADLFTRYMEGDLKRVPTPNQYDWIVAEVDRYYAHYQAGSVVASEPN